MTGAWLNQNSKSLEENFLERKKERKKKVSLLLSLYKDSFGVAILSRFLLECQARGKYVFACRTLLKSNSQYTHAAICCCHAAVIKDVQ